MESDYRLIASRNPDRFDLRGAEQFNLLTFLGLREYHYLLDIACGPLRVGRLLIPYLLSGHYFGLDINEWAVNMAIKYELGRDIFEVKEPQFLFDGEFNLSRFGRKFDFLLAQGIFYYVGTYLLRKCFVEIKKVMGPESILLATFRIGLENYTGDECTYPEVKTHHLDFIRSEVTNQGLKLKFLEWPHRRDAVWVAITSSFNEKPIPATSQEFFDAYRELVEGS